MCVLSCSPTKPRRMFMHKKGGPKHPLSKRKGGLNPSHSCINICIKYFYPDRKIITRGVPWLSGASHRPRRPPPLRRSLAPCLGRRSPPRGLGRRCVSARPPCALLVMDFHVFKTTKKKKNVFLNTILLNFEVERFLVKTWIVSPEICQRGV